MAARQPRGANRERRMKLADHLREFRNRLIISAIAIVVFSVGGWFVAPFVWDQLREPITVISEAHNSTINYSDISSAFDLTMQIALTVGIVASSPIWLYQILAFIVPGLNRREKKYTFGFFFSAVPLFLAGCATGWYVIPHIVVLLTSFVPSEDASFIDARSYLSFVLKLVIAVGIGFVLPVFLVLLDFIGILTAKSILKAWRWALIVVLLFCGIVTPSTDLLSMFMLAIPLMILYFAAIGVSWINDLSVARREAKLAAELA
jgi:sec-independent protein translocase protein TatC